MASQQRPLSLLTLPLVAAAYTLMCLPFLSSEAASAVENIRPSPQQDAAIADGRTNTQQQFERDNILHRAIHYGSIVYPCGTVDSIGQSVLLRHQDLEEAEKKNGENHDRYQTQTQLVVVEPGCAYNLIGNVSLLCKIGIQHTEEVSHLHKRKKLFSGQQPRLRDTVPINETGKDSVTTCPTWTYHHHEDNMTCVCGDGFGGAVRCNNHTRQVSVLVQGGYAMSLIVDDDSEFNGTVVVGVSQNELRLNHGAVMYQFVPNNTLELNEFFCEGLNKEGVMCSKCKEGFGVGYLLQGYDRCYNCSVGLQAPWTWIAAFTLKLIPVTLLFFYVFVFRLRVSCAPLNSIVLFCQLVAMIERNGLYRSMVNANHYSKTIFTIYNVWNLDYTPSSIHDSCLSEGITVLHTHAFYYVLVLYLVVLTLVTFGLVYLDDRGCRPVWLFFKPLHRCVATFKWHWQFSNSLIDILATFTVLVYWKMVRNTVKLLMYTTLYDVQGSRVGPKRYYFNASMEYFGSEHRPYAVPAVVLGVLLLVLPPALLLSNQLKVVHRVLSGCSSRWQKCFLYLKSFADAFQGCFKDGTDNTRDYRCFAFLYFFIRVLMVVLIDVVPLWHIPAVGVMHLCISISFAVLRPYKKEMYNVLDCLVFAALSAMYFLQASVLLSLLLANFHPSKESFLPLPTTWSTVIFQVLMSLPLGYVVYYCGSFLWMKVCRVYKRRRELEERAAPLSLEQSGDFTQLSSLFEREKGGTYTWS